MATTPINGLPSPTDASPNDPPIHFDALNGVLDSRLMARFTTTAARDAAITSPVNGMSCWCASPGAFYDRIGGAWIERAVPPRLTGLSPQTGWSTPSSHGQQVFKDTSGLVCCTGWVQNDAALTAADQIPVLIPSGFWPVQSHFFNMPVFATSGVYIPPPIVEVNNSGQVIVRRTSGGIPTPSYWDLSCIRYHPQSTA